MRLYSTTTWCVPHRRASATEEMRIQQGEGHDELICDVEDLLTDTEGPLGLLEKHLEFYDAHVLLSSTLQVGHYLYVLCFNCGKSLIVVGI